MGAANIEYGHVFQVRETTDDRGGLGKVIGYAHTQSVAEKLADKKGWYGGMAKVIRFRCIFISEGVTHSGSTNVYLLAQEEPISSDEIHDDSVHAISGLAKLTDEEKKALGLEEKD